MNDSNCPRILHITRNLPPLVGGMERLNWHITDELSRRAQVQVIGPQGSAALKPANVELSEVPLRPLPRFLLASAWRALRLARRQRPQIVLAGSGLTAPAAWLAARACGARAVAYVHGLDVAVRQRRYLITMAVRTACFLAFLVVPGWWKVVMLVAAAVLPAIGVLLANNTDHHAPATVSAQGDGQDRLALTGGEVVPGSLDEADGAGEGTE